jgi:beta-glucosidase
VSSGTQITSSLSDTDLDAAARAAAGKDVALVFITADSGEFGYVVEFNFGDRNDLTAWHGGVSRRLVVRDERAGFLIGSCDLVQDALVRRVASVNNNTVVVVNTVGPIIVEEWIDHPNGESSLADVLRVGLMSFVDVQ